MQHLNLNEDGSSITMMAAAEENDIILPKTNKLNEFYSRWTYDKHIKGIFELLHCLIFHYFNV